MNIRFPHRHAIALVALAFFIALGFASSGEAASAVWRPSHPSPGMYFNHFYVVDTVSGDIGLVFASESGGTFTEMYRVGNLFTGEIAQEPIANNFGDPDRHGASLAMVWRPSHGAPAGWYHYFYVTDDDTGFIYRVVVLSEEEPQVLWVERMGNVFTGDTRSVNLTRNWLQQDFRNVQRMARIFDTTTEDILQVFGL